HIRPDRDAHSPVRMHRSESEHVMPGECLYGAQPSTGIHPGDGVGNLHSAVQLSRCGEPAGGQQHGNDARGAMKNRLVEPRAPSARLRSNPRGAQRGSSLVEQAVVLVILLTILFAIIDFGRALYTYHFVSNAAREATRWASVRSSSSTLGSADPTTI